MLNINAKLRPRKLPQRSESVREKHEALHLLLKMKNQREKRRRKKWMKM